MDGATPYTVAPRALTRHTLVAGTTGSGKTNTVLALLFALAERGVPFLVIEPAKSEYRALLAHSGFGEHVQVFTPGTETVSPFRLNPFEVGPGESVAGHLDLLRAAFNASFGMWTPLPQVLEQCLHEIYVDAGWDLATDRNQRLDADSDRTLAFPTLTDLLAKVPDVVRRAGYEERIEADIRAALVTRLRSLRVGGKGAMLDVARSIPMDALLARPTVLELEWLGDDDDKALVMGLLLVRIAEHRRAAGQAGELVHVTVIEEAHRLLSRVQPRSSEESADPRGRAVETFVNLLAEIRAYGQGIVVADQVPLRLAPEILKNTNLKIAHRTVAAEDREALAGAMAMDAAQARALTSLPAGRAAVFSGGDDTPLLVDVVDVKDQLAAHRPSNAAVSDRMRSWRESAGLGSW
ncbi:MAG: ATP-binding protein, partial [Pseudonocardiaceae bacterium]